MVLHLFQKMRKYIILSVLWVLCFCIFVTFHISVYDSWLMMRYMCDRLQVYLRFYLPKLWYLCSHFIFNNKKNNNHTGLSFVYYFIATKPIFKLLDFEISCMSNMKMFYYQIQMIFLPILYQFLHCNLLILVSAQINLQM